MQIDVSEKAGVDVVRPTGELTDEGSDELTARVAELLARRGRRIVLDMQGVSYMNSAGLSTLVNLNARANLQESRVLLAATTPFVTNVLEMTKLTRYFEVCASVDEAVGRLA